MIYVIGSGPSGIACARMLLKKGAHVIMLDAGLKLEEDRQNVVRSVRGRDPAEWNEAFLKNYKAGFQIDPKGTECKPAYGSLFPYRDVAPYRSVYKNVKTRPSYACGGLSNVWGGSSVAYSSADIGDWPITAEGLKPYYGEVFSFFPIAKAGTAPDVPECFSAPEPEELKMSRQALGLSERIQKIRHESSGVFQGGSRLAVESSPKNKSDPKCIYCGLCMYGCPFSLIYNSASTLEELQKNKNFEYRSGIFVESIEEAGGEVLIHARDLATKVPRVFHAEKVFLGSGVFSTARVLLRSYGAYNKPLFCLDSQYFLFPLISLWGTPGALVENVHTLAQLYFWTQKPSAKKAAFLQIYGYNDLYRKEISSLFGFAAPALNGFVEKILERLFVVQGYLHSDDSARIRIELRHGSSGEDELFLEGIRSSGTSRSLRNEFRKFSKVFRKKMVFPLIPMMDLGAPGRGYHSGGTFPMRVHPSFGESDLVGRPYGFKNVHLVDSSVFPTIPAGPITVNVMANAARIADQSWQKTGA